MAARTFKLAVPVDKTGATRAFKGLTDLRKWLNEEMAKWDWFRKFANWRHTQLLPSQLTEFYSTLDTRIRELDQISDESWNDEQKRTSALSGLKEVFKNYPGKGRVIFSDSAEGKAALQLADSDQWAAGFFVAYLTSDQWPDNLQSNLKFDSKEAMKGAFLAAAFEEGMKGRSAGEMLAFAEVKQTLQEGVNTAQELQDRFHSAVATAEKALEDHSEAVNNALKAHEEASSEQMSKIASEWQTLHATYEQAIALQAPVRYWKIRRRQHHGAVIALKRWSIGFAGVGAVCLCVLIWFVLPPEVFEEHVQAALTGRYLVVATAAILYLWSVRLLVRLLLQNILLKTDAEERSTLLQTYLAFVGRKEGLKESEKLYIFQSLFRSALGSRDADDAIPLPAIEIGKLINRENRSPS